MEKTKLKDVYEARVKSGIVIGFIISIVLGSALVIAAAKAGIVPGVSPLVVLFSWIIFGSIYKDRLKGFLAISQVTGSAGATVTAGVVFVAPIIQIIYAEKGLPVPDVDIPLMILASMAGVFMGWGFVGLSTKRFLSDPRLPAPEAVACDRLIRTAVSNPDKRPPVLSTLFPGLFGGFAVSGLLNFGYLKAGLTKLKFKLPLLFSDAGASSFDVSVPIKMAPVYIGIGALLTLPTAILAFVGGVINSVTQGYAAATDMPGTTFRWVGGAAMGVAVIYSLIHYALETKTQFAKKRSEVKGNGLDDSLLEMSTKTRTALIASVVFGMFLLLVMMFMTGLSLTGLVVLGTASLILGFLLSGLGGLLSLQIGSSASPVSGTVFMGMLILSLAAIMIGLEGIQGVNYLVPIVVACCVAICAANDSSQDYKTMQLNGLKVSTCFSGQLYGLIGGAICVPITLWLAHKSFVLGSPELPAPQASFFATVLSSLFLETQIPWGPVLAGGVVGLVGVAVEIIGRKKGMILSSLALAVGIYLPAYIGTGMLIGSLVRYIGTRSVGAATNRGILNAAGLITGDALFSLLLGVMIICGINLDSLNASAPWSAVANFVGMAFVLGFIWLNYRKKYIDEAVK